VQHPSPQKKRGCDIARKDMRICAETGDYSNILHFSRYLLRMNVLMFFYDEWPYSNKIYGETTVNDVKL
jgi:hypothetical protein